jgi:hypothetical protein
MSNISKIVGYHQGYWVAELSAAIVSTFAIGRHVERSWVLTEAGRTAYIGHPVECPQCLLESRQKAEHNRSG